MEKALPGEPTKPAFPTAHQIVLELATPAKRPGSAPPAAAKADAKPADKTAVTPVSNVTTTNETSAGAVDQSELAQVYGFRLAETACSAPAT